MLDVLQMHGNMINYYRFKTIYIYIHETTYVSTNIDIRYWHCIDMCISKINPSIYISILSIYPLWPSIGWLNKNTNHQQFYLDNQLRAKYIYIWCTAWQIAKYHKISYSQTRFMLVSCSIPPSWFSGDVFLL